MKPDPSKNWRDWRDAIRWAACSTDKRLAAVLTEALQEAEEEREKINALIEAVCEKHGVPTGPTPMASLRKLLFKKETA